MKETCDGDERTIVVPACELRTGDRIVVDGAPADVVSEPLTLHRGMGLFDDFELLVGVQTRRPDTNAAHLHAWSPLDPVTVVCTDCSLARRSSTDVDAKCERRSISRRTSTVAIEPRDPPQVRNARG